MAVFFLDTSALVKPYLREVGADTVRSILAGARERIYISSHVALEVVATFAYKLRDRQVDGRTYRRIRRDFFADIPRSLRMAEVDKATLERAMLLADEHRAIGVGSVDLIHIATVEQLAEASGTRPTIVCADRAMRNLAAAAGFGVFNPETDDPATLAAGG